MPAAAHGRRWRRLLSVWGVAGLALLLTFLLIGRHQVRQQRMRELLAAEIQRTGGYFWPGPTVFERIDAWRRGTSIHDWVGDASLESGSINDEWLRTHDDLRSLKFSNLAVVRTRLSPDAVARLVNGRRLQGLCITQSGFGPTTVRAIRRQTGLSVLLLQDVGLTNDDLGQLPLEQLAELDICGTKVTPAGLHHLKRCGRLERLLLDVRQLGRREAVKKLERYFPECDIIVF